MKKITLLILIYSLTFLCYSFCQDNKGATFIISRTCQNGKFKEFVLNPKKSIAITLNDNIEYIFRNPIFVDDSTFKINKGVVRYNESSSTVNNGIIQLSIIKQIQGKYDTHEYKTRKIILLVLGGVLLHAAGIAIISNRYGGSDNPEDWRNYQKSQKPYKDMAIIGGVTLFCGICLPLHLTTNSSKKWNIKLVRNN